MDVTTNVDGRRLRRVQNRDAVLDAMISLWRSGRYGVSTADIAEEAGLSPRSVFRYFDDVDDLSRAAIERHLSEAKDLFAIGAEPTDPTDRKVAAAVSARLRLYDAIEPGARAGRAVAHRNPVVNEQLHASRTSFRNQLATLFAPELRDRPDALAPLDVLLSFESRELLLLDHRLSKPAATAVLVSAITALLEG